MDFFNQIGWAKYSRTDECTRKKFNATVLNFNGTFFNKFFCSCFV